MGEYYTATANMLPKTSLTQKSVLKCIFFSHKSKHNKNIHLAIAYQTDRETDYLCIKNVQSKNCKRSTNLNTEEKSKRLKTVMLSKINTLPADPHTNRSILEN